MSIAEIQLYDKIVGCKLYVYFLQCCQVLFYTQICTAHFVIMSVFSSNTIATCCHYTRLIFLHIYFLIIMSIFSKMSFNDLVVLKVLGILLVLVKHLLVIFFKAS